MKSCFEDFPYAYIFHNAQFPLLLHIKVAQANNFKAFILD